MNITWTVFQKSLNEALARFSFQDGQGKSIDPEEGFKIWMDSAFVVRKQQGVVYLIGNGASASMASHFAADLAKNARLHTQVFSDLSLITAIANDMGYENIFLEPLKRRATRGDMLIAISSSGKSKNILQAVSYAGSIGMNVVTLSGMDVGNPLRTMGSLNIYVPGSTYGIVETCHATILHYWMDKITGQEKNG